MFVLKSTYDATLRLLERTLEQNHELTKLIADLRRDGFQAKAPVTREKREPVGTPDLDEIAKEGAKKEFIERFAKDLRQSGISELAARQEAERMANEMYEHYHE